MTPRARFAIARAVDVLNEGTFLRHRSEPRQYEDGRSKWIYNLPSSAAHQVALELDTQGDLFIRVDPANHFQVDHHIVDSQSGVEVPDYQLLQIKACFARWRLRLNPDDEESNALADPSRRANGGKLSSSYALRLLQANIEVGKQTRSCQSVVMARAAQRANRAALVDGMPVNELPVSRRMPSSLSQVLKA